MEATIAKETEPLTLGIHIHPELHYALKDEAHRRRTTMRAILHAMLCRELGREDLLEIKSRPATC